MAAAYRMSPCSGFTGSALVGSGFLTSRRTVGLRDTLRVFFAPRSLFARVENVPAYGWPLIILLTTVTLIGYATVQTGLIDREVDKAVQREIARLDLDKADVVQRSEISKMIEDLKKGGEFHKLMARMAAIVLEPVRLLASMLLLSSLFYGLVALSGKKPEWHTLMSVVVFSSFIDAARMLFELILKLRCASLTVDTSAGALFPMLSSNLPVPKEAIDIVPATLSGFDPFRIWFWIVVVVGLNVTSQLRGWRGWVPCLLLWIGGAGVRTGLAAAAAHQRQKEAAESGVRVEVSDARPTPEASVIESSEPGAPATGYLANSTNSTQDVFSGGDLRRAQLFVPPGSILT